MTARGEVAGGEQDRYAADGEGGQAVAQGFVGCVGQDEGKNAECDQRECVVWGFACICVVYGYFLIQFYSLGSPCVVLPLTLLSMGTAPQLLSPLRGDALCRDDFRKGGLKNNCDTQLREFQLVLLLH